MSDAVKQTYEAKLEERRNRRRYAIAALPAVVTTLMSPEYQTKLGEVNQSSESPTVQLIEGLTFEIADAMIAREQRDAGETS